MKPPKEVHAISRRGRPPFPLAPVLPILVLLFLPARAEALSGKDVVARVNGIPLLASSLNCAQDAMGISLPAPPSPAGEAPHTESQVQRMALERLIDLELLYQEGLKQHNPDLTSETERRFRAEVARFPDRQSFARALACSDLNEEGLRRLIQRHLVIARLLDETVYAGLAVDEDTVERFYRENAGSFLRPERARVQHILIRVKEWNDPRSAHDGRAKAEHVRAEAAGGGDFATLARRYSDEPASAARGGDWGAIERHSYGAQFDTVVFNLGDGEVSVPIASHLGFHIVKVLQRIPAEMRPLAEVRGEIVSLLRRREAEKRMNDLRERLRRKARIEILLEDR